MAKDTKNDGGSGNAEIDLDDIPLDETDKDLKGDRGDDFDPEADKKEAPKKEKKEAPKKEKKDPEAEEEDEEAEEDEESEEEDEEEEEGEKGKKPASKTVPIQRMDAIKARLNKKAEAAEARVRELEDQLRSQRQEEGDSTAAKKFFEKIDSLYEAVEQARLDGNAKEAAKLQRELDTMKEQASTAKQQYMANQEALRINETAAFNAVVDFIEAKVPELDPNSDDFDESLMEDVQAITRGYEERGMRPADALKKALKVALQRDIFATDLKKKDVQPKKTDVKKNLETAKKQPADIQEGAGPEKSQKIDVSKLTDEELEKLPEQTKRRLRGDFL